MQIPATRSVSGVELAAADRHAPPAADGVPLRSLETRVTLSSAPSEQPTTYRPAASQSLASKAAHDDPKLAEQLAHDLAYTDDSIGLDATDWVNGTGPLRIKATGEPLTPEFEAKFKAESAKVRDERVALYESEKAKGTHAADILDKLEDMFSKLPQDYQDLVRFKGG
jgi:hypothetical protein